VRPPGGDSSLPQMRDMITGNALSGRMERRLPIIIAVHLARGERAGTDGEEKAYTDNVSTHGARVFSIRPWEPGDAVRVTPRKRDPTCGTVVYCQMLSAERYVIGVNFQDSLWSRSLARMGSEGQTIAASQ
jgi:hypothetical protein